jgi:hypothetical protein
MTPRAVLMCDVCYNSHLPRPLFFWMHIENFWCADAEKAQLKKNCLCDSKKINCSDHVSFSVWVNNLIYGMRLYMRWCLMLFICIINVHAAQKHSLVACSISYMWAREGNLFYFARISLPLRPAHISSFIDDAVGYSFVFISCALMGLAADKWHKCKSIKLHQLHFLLSIELRFMICKNESPHLLRKILNFFLVQIKMHWLKIRSSLLWGIGIYRRVKG